jgi:hypothetical protein
MLVEKAGSKRRACGPAKARESGREKKVAEVKGKAKESSIPEVLMRWHHLKSGMLGFRERAICLRRLVVH